MYVWLASVYTIHRESGDQDGQRVFWGPYRYSEPIFLETPVARSIQKTLQELSVYAIFLLSGDQTGRS